MPVSAIQAKTRKEAKSNFAGISVKDRAKKVLELLKREYPDARAALSFSSPFELLIATILSAQCTDARVNMVTPGLFAKYPSPKSLAGADRKELEKEIKSTGFFRQKAKSILSTSKSIVEKYDGEVPRTMEELLTLDGVGRKTANVVLGNAFGIPGIAVDTHVRRLSRRLGFSKEDDPTKIEFDLMDLFPPKDWAMLSHLLISHGRRVCTARLPKCEGCIVNKLCPSALGFTGKEGKN
ncbi:MAG TPA: endonuclease III [Candidatus Acidoferrales bacterium]|nr:endonuclease III [Candidatus Acidoferrales bacterium]